MLVVGLLAVCFFVFGLVTGEVLLVGSKNGAFSATWADSPSWFVVVMVANLAIALLIWGVFFAWLRERRR